VDFIADNFFFTVIKLKFGLSGYAIPADENEKAKKCTFELKTVG
jgi:hypothetical protein